MALPQLRRYDVVVHRLTAVGPLAVLGGRLGQVEYTSTSSAILG
jgi:hypothetical protein